MSHIVGKTYDMNQQNWNKLIAELDTALARSAELERQVAVMREALERLMRGSDDDGYWSTDLKRLRDDARKALAAVRGGA